jgi:broad specificity phosphatase PhoE
VATVYLVQHGDKERTSGDPGLTPAGRHQAELAGRRLRQAGLRGLYASPLRRARETADLIAAVTGLPARIDARLRERLNWDGSGPLESFLAEWAHTTQDRDYVPGAGESSHQAGNRLQTFIARLPAGTGPVALVTHGGVTVDLLRNMLPDEALPAGLLETGIPPGAITTITGLRVDVIAATEHLSPSPPQSCPRYRAAPRGPRI